MPMESEHITEVAATKTADKTEKTAAEVVTKPSYIITVGREFCSGGAEIAQKLAEKLGIAYYDKNIIDHTAEVLKISTESVAEQEEKPAAYSAMLGYQYHMGIYHYDPSLMLPMSMRVADAQFSLVKQYAKQGSCVIVGRCANEILRDYENVISVFIHADPTFRLNRARHLYQLREKEARKLLRRTDKIRSSYYRYYAHGNWGSCKTYSLCLDSSVLGIEGCVQAVIGALRGRGLID